MPFTTAPDPRRARVIWYACNLATLAGYGLVMVRQWLPRLLPVAGPRELAIVGATTLALSARHIAAVFNTQSHDLLLCGVLVLGADQWLCGRAAGAGAIVGIGAALKATPLLFVTLPAPAKAWSAKTSASACWSTACSCGPRWPWRCCC
ncbi:MAG: glycosyltransferase 87 family protein [Planctomycetota bacterium]